MPSNIEAASAAATSNPKSEKKNNETSSSSSTPSDYVVTDPLTLLINSSVVGNIPKEITGARVNHVTVNHKDNILIIGLNENFTYRPVNEELVKTIKTSVESVIPDSLSGYTPVLKVGNVDFDIFIDKIDPLPPKTNYDNSFVKSVHPYSSAVNGLSDDIIAIWHSHGRYYTNGNWAWQRPVLFGTWEDAYTMSYMLPYIVPMLENAGAYVMLPRERDINPYEVIVDFDTNDGGAIYSQTSYNERSRRYKWETGNGNGFIYDLSDFRDTENPFTGGSYRQVRAEKGSKDPSFAIWVPDFPTSREYAVYVSYKTLPNSVPDAKYTVNYSGGSREFIVNQTMGGGTWIYLGTFPFKKGSDSQHGSVVLNNATDFDGDFMVTADAVKFGGGMGNISRSQRRSDVDNDNYNTPAEPTKDVGYEISSGKRIGTTPFSISGIPRWLEGARYWLHWAGIPEPVYSPYHGENDYKDDYTCRGHWVNYLAGGSNVLPQREGLNIPVDLSFGLHSDAGKRADDSFIGTLGIYSSNNGGNYSDGTPRINSRTLTDLVMTQITKDIRAQWEPNWTRRSMWDKKYLEASIPEVPAVLIELMSHQNFADMQYGLDPNFRFTVSRAIYKGIAHFLAQRKNRELVIQPLPVKNFAIIPSGKNKFKLEWRPSPDPLEPTAMPTKYIIEERMEGELGFHKIAETKDTQYSFEINEKEAIIHSYRIIAANEGGVSFPSEILSMCNVKNQTPVLIVNGFTRVSAPGHFSKDGEAGFDRENDFGVPYINEFSFSGYQTGFDRKSTSFGKSNSNYIGKVIAGNTFDFTTVHGLSIADQETGYVSCSLGAVEEGMVNLQNFKIVDLILGKQKATTVGRGNSGVNYRTFPPKFQQQLEKYLDKGGNLIVSGQYVASDLFGDYSNVKDRMFATDVLGIVPIESDEKSKSGRISTVPNDFNDMDIRYFSYSNTPNEDIYVVEKPDAIMPAIGFDGQVFMELSDTADPVGVFMKKGKSKRVVLSVPFEAIDNADQRFVLMEEFLKFLK